MVAPRRPQRIPGWRRQATNKVPWVGATNNLPMVAAQTGSNVGRADGRTDTPESVTRDGLLLRLQVFAVIFIGALAFALLFVRRSPDSYDASIMLQVTQNLVTHGSVRVLHDPLGLNSPYSTYGIGPSLLMAPFYLAGRAVGANPVSVAMLMNAVLWALLVVTVTALARLRRSSWSQALVVAGLVGVGTPLIAYVATGFSEVGVALAIAAGLLGIEATRQQSTWGPQLACAAAGSAVLFRTDSVLLVAPFIVGATWLVSNRRRRDSIIGVATLAPFVAVWASYNVVRFGAPWDTGYGGQPFNHSLLAGVYGLVLSPGRGLIVYAPVLLVAAVGGVRLWRRDRLMLTVATLLLLSRVLFYAKWWGWFGGGGWGPRLVVPAVPVLALGLVEVLQAWERLALPAKILCGAVAAWSVAINVAGAAVDYLRADENSLLGRFLSGPAHGSVLQRLATPHAERQIDHVLFGVRGFPATDELSRLLHGETLAGRFLQPNVEWGFLVLFMAVAAASVLVLLRLLSSGSQRIST